MRKTALLLILLGLLATGFSKPNIKNLGFTPSIEVYGLFETNFQLDRYDNPYDPEVIDVFADFTAPDGRTFRVIGFYFEGYGFVKEKNYELSSPKKNTEGWKIRFTPDMAGRWTFVIHAIDKDGETVSGKSSDNPLWFECRQRDAEGFITIANSKFLKRDAIVNGRRQSKSYFPIGPNVAWYDAADNGKYQKPYGIYDYQRYFQALSGNANYVRIWLNRYQFLSLYGPEHAGTPNGKTVMYFDNTVNQKDAAELDQIVAEALKHNISLMPCIFNYRNFSHKNGVPTGTDANPARPSDWVNNPYHTVLNLQSPFDFFSDARAVRVTKNLIRYIVARWGYATNILCWELWNEVANMADGVEISVQTQREMVDWHVQMTDYIRSIDPYRHPVTTSLGSGKNLGTLENTFEYMDIVQDHNYQNIQKAKSKEQFSYILYKKAEKARSSYPYKPYFMGEFGFGQSGSNGKYKDKDPKGVDMHNSLWSSTFSGSMGPASFWYWEVLDQQDWYKLTKPMLTFFNNLPLLSDSFTAETTSTERGRSLVFPNNLETYYLVNADCDTLLGWAQDTAFCYQSLRRLTDRADKDHFLDQGLFDPKGYVYTLDPSKRPGPSSDSNRIVLPVKNQPRGTKYEVRWFDAETGLELTEEATTVTVRRPFLRGRRITVEFPSSIRDLEGSRINNTFGDAVFMITKISD